MTGDPLARARSIGEVLSGSGAGMAAGWGPRTGTGMGTGPGTGTRDGAGDAALPRPGGARAAARTGAVPPVSHCTRYFGVPEERLPALLVLCLHEEQDVLVQLDERTGVYELCKQIAARSARLLLDRGLFEERDRLGNRVEWLGRTVESRERERRTSACPLPDDPELERDREELEEDRARLEALERRLATRRGLSAAAVDAARAVLGADAETGTLPAPPRTEAPDDGGTGRDGSRGGGTGEGEGEAYTVGSGRRMLTVRAAERRAEESAARGAGAAGDRAGPSEPDGSGAQVRNSIAGATIYGTVVQGGDMGSVHIQPPPRPDTSPPPAAS